MEGSTSEALCRDYEHHCRAAGRACEKPEVESVSGSIKKKVRKTRRAKRGEARSERASKQASKQATRQIDSSDKAASRPRNY